MAFSSNYRTFFLSFFFFHLDSSYPSRSERSFKFSLPSSLSSSCSQISLQPIENQLSDRSMGNASAREEGSKGVDGAGGSCDDKSGAGDIIAASLRPQSSSEYMANSPAAASPSSSRSPHPFTPQQPVASLQRAEAASPMFNHMWRSEKAPASSPVNSPPQKAIPTLITWSHGGENVAVQGSWDNWVSRKILQRAGKDHSLLLVLPCGIFHYRFLVDGQTKHSPDLPSVTDEMGNVCHVLDVHGCVPESLDGVSQFDVPGSPDSSYDQDFPEEDDFSREPGLVPPQLHTTVLDMPKAEEGTPSPRPQHVVLNHLYMEKGWASESVVALGLTHRFESKYVTVVLYKPVKR